MSPLSIVSICNLIIIAIAIIFNSVGIYGLLSMKSNRTFQKLILLNLSMGEILVSVVAIPYFVLISLGTDPNSYTTEKLFGTATSFRLPLYSMMIFLTVDRLIACKMHFSYRQLITRRVATIILAFSWASGAAYYTADLLSAHDVTKRYSKIIFTVVDSIFLFLVTITYTYILRRIMEQRHLLQNTPEKNHFQRRKAKFFKVLSAIILTFTLLVAIPDIVVTILQLTNQNIHFYTELLHKCVTGLFLLALPIIYIFANKEIWAFLIKRLPGINTVRKESNSQVELHNTPSQAQSQI